MGLENTNFWERLRLFVEAVNVNDAMSCDEKKFILETCRQQIEMLANKHTCFGISLREFQEIYPTSTSSDLQAFTIGWKLRDKTT